MEAYRYDNVDGPKANRAESYANLVSADGDGWLCSKETFSRLARDRGLREAKPWKLDEARWAAAKERLVTAWTALVQDPLPDEVRDEVQLLLYCRASLRLEYMGRGHLKDQHLPAAREDLLFVDLAGRGRDYLFRVVKAGEGRDDRMQRIAQSWGQWADWILDPKAKVVLSFGGGGFRLFGATTVLKVLDRIVGDDRTRIGEVWGSSGGALLGYTFAMGYSAETLEELGYDLYHARNPELNDGSISRVVASRLKGLVRDLRGKQNKADMLLWLEELEKKQPASGRRTSRLPFFAHATNPERGGITALAAAEHIPESCRDILFPCDPREAVAASTAVPVLLAAQQGITGLGADDTWVDGSIVDENPLTLPYVKWLRERAERPDSTPERLKIIQVSLNLRSSEVPLLKALERVPVVRKVKIMRRFARLIDLALDSKTEAVIRAMTETAAVEVFSLKLNLGALHLNDPKDIPAAIRAGRSLDSWQTAMYRKLA